jgi:hypothetical protein
LGELGKELRVRCADGGFRSSRRGAGARWDLVGAAIAEGHHADGDPGLPEGYDRTLQGRFRHFPGLLSIAEEE